MLVESFDVFFDATNTCFKVIQAHVRDEYQFTVTIFPEPFWCATGILDVIEPSSDFVINVFLQRHLYLPNTILQLSGIDDGERSDDEAQQ